MTHFTNTLLNPRQPEAMRDLNLTLKMANTKDGPSGYADLNARFLAVSHISVH